jgi:hypothetical protein
LSYSRPLTESSVLRRFQAPLSMVVFRVTRLLTCLLHAEMRRPGELFNSLSYSLRNGCILRVAVLSSHRLNPFSSGETSCFSMLSAVTNSTSRHYLRRHVDMGDRCYFMTRNPELFKELFVFFNIMIALARRLSTTARCFKNYCSAMQDMVSLSGLVLLLF